MAESICGWDTVSAVETTGVNDNKKTEFTYDPVA